MARVILATLFVFALAAQSGSIGANHDGIRSPTVVAPANRLTEYAECNDIDQDLPLLYPTLDLATPARERLLRRAFLNSLRQLQYCDRNQTPLYERHAVWRI